MTILSGGVPGGEINEPVATGGGDSSGVLRYVDGVYAYTLSARQLPDEATTYRLTITVPRTGQTVTAMFGIK